MKTKEYLIGKCTSLDNVKINFYLKKERKFYNEFNNI